MIDPSGLASHQARSLQGKAALVTGAGVRVGRAIALALGQAGMDLALHYRGSKGPAEELAATLAAQGRKVVLVQGDQAVPDGPEGIVAQAVAGLGRLDLLVCSAAIFERAPAASIGREQFEAMLATNLLGPFFLAQAARGALEATQGSIVQLLDLCGTRQVWPGYAHYAAAKAGLAAVTQTLALEWAPGVRVNGIAPGVVLLPEGTPDAERQRRQARIPMGRVGSPEDVARAVLYLASEPWVTGQILAVDGGRSIAP